MQLCAKREMPLAFIEAPGRARHGRSRRKRVGICNFNYSVFAINKQIYIYIYIGCYHYHRKKGNFFCSLSVIFVSDEH
jgi:hypothetical protein